MVFADAAGISGRGRYRQTRTVLADADGIGGSEQYQHTRTVSAVANGIGSCGLHLHGNPGPSRHGGGRAGSGPAPCGVCAGRAVCAGRHGDGPSRVLNGRRLPGAGAVNIPIDREAAPAMM